MINVPLFALLLITTVICLKTKAAKGGSVALGLLLGLTMASTTLGAPVLEAVTAASSGLIDAIGAIGAK